MVLIRTTKLGFGNDYYQHAFQSVSPMPPIKVLTELIPIALMIKLVVSIYFKCAVLIMNIFRLCIIYIA